MFPAPSKRKRLFGSGSLDFNFLVEEGRTLHWTRKKVNTLCIGMNSNQAVNNSARSSFDHLAPHRSVPCSGDMFKNTPVSLFLMPECRHQFVDSFLAHPWVRTSFKRTCRQV